MPRRSAWDPGSVFEIALPNGGFAYGLVIAFPLAAFFGTHFAARQSLATVLASPLAFRIWIMRSCLGRRGWPVVGFAPVPASLQQPPTFYKFDIIARRFSLYSEGREWPATREECLDLECAAVWNMAHVVSRLEDQFAGRPSSIDKILSAARHTEGSRSTPPTPPDA